MPKHEFEPCGGFILRAAALALDEVLVADQGAAAARLDRLFERPDVVEALAIASPSLLRVIEQRKRDPGSKKGRAAARTLLRYATRMASRPTPFGTFAGYAVGHIDRATGLALRARDAWTRTTQLDVGWLSGAARRLTLDERFRDHVSLTVHEALHQGPLQTRWPVRRPGDHFPGRYVSVAPHAWIDAVLARARSGASFEELVSACRACEDSVTRGEATQTVVQLCRAGALVSSLEPPITGDAPPLPYLQAALAGLPAGRALGEALAGVRAALDALDARGVGASPADHEAIARSAARALEAEDSPQLRVDLHVTPAQAALSGETTQAVLTAVHGLARVMGRPGNLDRFRTMFERRFEHAPQGVPLLDLLDEVDGVMSTGYEAVGTPELVAGAPIAPPERASTWSRRDRWLLGKLEAAWACGQQEIALDDADLDGFDAPSLPDCFAASIEVFEPAGGGSDRVFLGGISAPTGARTFTRLGRGSPAAAELARQLIEREQALDPSGVFAEVIACGEGADLQPSFRPYEIPLGGRSGAPAERQIHLRELTVLLDRGEIVLWCERLGKKVIPRVTTALAVASIARPALYWFLGNLQHQGHLASASWDWGPLVSAGFLPRVSIGSVIVSLASWKLERAWLDTWWSCDHERRVEMLRALRDERGLPRLVTVSSDGERLLVDLDDAASAEVGFKELESSSGPHRLAELSPDGALPKVRSEYGRHVSEIVLPFRRVADGAAAPVRPAPRVPHPDGRVLPGGEWLYVRLAVPAASTDRVLHRVVRPLVQREHRGHALKTWFFVRHVHDGAPELRLRFHGDPAFLWCELLGALRARVASCGAAIHGMRIDTYDRELARYGGELGTRLIESLACADSDWVIGLLGDPVLSDALDRRRLAFALHSVRQLLVDFGCSPEHCHRLLGARVAATASELEPPLRHAIAAKLHDRGVAWTELPVEATAGCARLLAARSAAVQPIAAALRVAALDGQVLPGVLHHAACRVFIGHERPQELAVYSRATTSAR
jgi:lantibiotic biosynthesis protein